MRQLFGHTGAQHCDEGGSSQGAAENQAGAGSAARATSRGKRLLLRLIAVLVLLPLLLDEAVRLTTATTHPLSRRALLSGLVPHRTRLLN